jgi:hypothetical protein
MHKLVRKMAGKFAGRSLLAYLYKQQSEKCAHCRQPITEATGWDRHHSNPSTSADDHLALLHPDCHDPVHHERLHDAKPASPPPRRANGNGAGVGNVWAVWGKSLPCGSCRGSGGTRGVVPAPTRLVFLPPHSPNLNLIEWLWKFVKAEVCAA